MSYKIHDLVWAKMNKCPYWPARIIKPNSSVKAPKSNEACQFVCFFGTDDVAWVNEENIIPHSEDVFQTDMVKKQSKSLQNAIEDFKGYLALPVGEQELSSSFENKIKPSRESVGKQQQSSPPKTAMGVFNVESGLMKHTRNVLVENSDLKKRPEVQPTDAYGEKSSSNSPEKPDNSENISFGNRHSFDKDESSKNVIVGGEHFIEKDMPMNANNHTETSDEMVISEHVISFDKKYGFIGLTEMGTAILEKFIRRGMEITLWDDSNKYEKFTTMEKGVKIANSPSELIRNCDITFCCQESNTDGFKNIIFGANGILKGFEEAENVGQRSGYVGLTRVNPEMSKKIQNSITIKNGMYIDSPVLCDDYTEKIGSCKLIIGAAGDEELFFDCEKCFKIITDHYFYVCYDVEINSNASMLFDGLSATTLAVMAETMALADRLNLYHSLDKVRSHLLEVDPLEDRAERMGKNNPTITPLGCIQNSINTALIVADAVCQRMPCTAAANELYKRAKILNYSTSDVTEVFKVIQS